MAWFSYKNTKDVKNFENFNKNLKTKKHTPLNTKKNKNFLNKKIVTLDKQKTFNKK